MPIVHAPEFHEKEYVCKGSDTKNIMSRPNNAGVSCAGNFIEENLPKEWRSANKPYVHVDLAAPAFQAELGTGYGVTLLSQLFIDAFSS